jgi:uncharacterized protein with NAD-binding domain and iron-sulfur cluster
MSNTSQKKKIAILGAGMASMVTAIELTNQDNWQEHYDITVYQLGWRLGGKGASGRNMSQHGPSAPDYRIQEHGFHIFFGFYANTFQVMKECYDHLEGDGLFANIGDAFKPHSFIVLEDYDFFRGQWVPWNLEYPYYQNEFPWNDNKQLPFWKKVERTINFMITILRDVTHLNEGLSSEEIATPLEQPIWHSEIREQLDLEWNRVHLMPAIELLEAIAKLISKMATVFPHLVEKLIQGIIWFLDQFHKRIETKRDDAIARKEIAALRILIMCNLCYAVIRGLLSARIFNLQSAAFNDLDRYDFAEWLMNNGAWNITVNSALVRAMYILLFGYQGGVPSTANRQLGAAAALRWVSEMNLGYKGAIMWKMQAGMGDTIFAPLYKVLKERGVKFEFFHRVANLSLNEQKNAIASIEMYRQVNLKNPEQGYDPLIRVKDLLCWPSEPLYEQIVEGDKLKKNNIDLESFWTPWSEIHQEDKVTLNYQQDFDIAVLGISLGAFPFICKELIEANSQWQQMVDNVKTITTQGGQLWLKPTLQQLGWKEDSPVLGAYIEPLDTYADMTHLLERENWPGDYSPNSIAYFTGVMEDPGIPDRSYHNFPAEQQKKIEQQAIAFLQNYIGPLWPEATTDNHPQGLDWNLLVDFNGTQGVKRFYSQYWRINIDPGERYVMSVPGSYQYRLQAGSSGFSNLYLTGDWIDNSLNSGCIEATTMAGMQAARAVVQNLGLKYHRQQIIRERNL